MTKRFLLLKKDNFFEFIDSEEAYLRTTDLEELLSIAEYTLNEQNIRIQELEEALGFCRDLLDGTCNSTRMKELHKIIMEVVTDD